MLQRPWLPTSINCSKRLVGIKIVCLGTSYLRESNPQKDLLNKLSAAETPELFLETSDIQISKMPRTAV